MKHLQALLMLFIKNNKLIGISIILIMFFMSVYFGFSPVIAAAAALVIVSVVGLINVAPLLIEKFYFGRTKNSNPASCSGTDFLASKIYQYARKQCDQENELTKVIQEYDTYCETINSDISQIMQALKTFITKAKTGDSSEKNPASEKCDTPFGIKKLEHLTKLIKDHIDSYPESYDYHKRRTVQIAIIQDSLAKLREHHNVLLSLTSELLEGYIEVKKQVRDMRELGTSAKNHCC